MEGYLRTTLGVGLTTTFSGQQAGKIDRREDRFLPKGRSRNAVKVPANASKEE